MDKMVMMEDSMKRKVTTAAELPDVDYGALRHANKLMRDLLDVLDDMDEDTYFTFEQYVSKNFYNDLANGIVELTQARF